MAKWILNFILLGSQFTFIGVVFTNYFFTSFASKLLPPASGPDPQMGLAPLLVVFVPAVILVTALALLSSFLILNVVSGDEKKIIVAIAFFIFSFIIQNYIAPAGRDIKLQKRNYKFLKKDLNDIKNKDLELIAMTTDQIDKFEFKGSKETWFFDYLKENTEIRDLLLSIFDNKEPLRISKATTFIILPKEFFWRHIVKNSGKTYTASYDFKDKVTIGESHYSLLSVEDFKAEDNPFLKIANARIFGKNRLGLHFQIVNTPYRFIIFVSGKRFSASYDRKRYQESLYTEPMIWKEDL